MAGSVSGSGSLSYEWIAPAGIVLVRLPVDAVGPICTGTTIVQKPFAGMTPDVIVIDVVPGVALTMPPAQVVVAAGERATV